MQSWSRYALALAALGASLLGSAAAGRAETTLRVVTATELKLLDPLITTLSITSTHGLMVYEPLYAVDARLRPKPMLVETHQTSPDGLTWSFRLREGKTFSNGDPLRADDVVASLKRWGSRIAAGQTLMAFVDEVKATGPLSFEIRLKRPFWAMLESLANPAFPLGIMRAKEAGSPVTEPVSEVIGSGPFVFDKAAWRPGEKIVYRRNPAYTPIGGEPDGLAGARIPKVDTVEWLTMPDANTAANALLVGEVDYLETPTQDLLPLFERSADIAIAAVDPIGSQTILIPNHLVPPFDDPKARRALLHIVGDQRQVLAGLIGNPALEKPCWAVFACGTPLETSEGIGAWATMSDRDNMEAAKALLKEAGYKGERVVIMTPKDQYRIDPALMVIASRLKDAGVNVDLQAMDWGTLVARRSVQAPPDADRRGWNLFATWGSTSAMLSPATHYAIATPCDRSNFFGWPCDEKLEEMRLAYFGLATDTDRRAWAGKYQARFYETVPYVPLGQYLMPVAYSRKLDGVLHTVRSVYWNIGKRQ